MVRCVLCHSEGEIHHVMSRGAFGKAALIEPNELPLCRKHHSEVHTIGRRTFADKYGLEVIFSQAQRTVQARHQQLLGGDIE